MGCLAAVTGIAGAFAANQARPLPQRLQHAPFAYARQAKAPGMLTAKEKQNLEALRRIAPEKQMDGCNELGYLQGPDNELWYYTGKYEIEEIVHSEYYTERRTTGFEYTVYDADLKPVGTVRDKVRLHDGETRVAALSLDATVSRKFFNSDDKYEVVVSIAANTPDYEVNQYSRAYSLGGARNDDGTDRYLTEIDGYIVEAVNTATDRWSERYYMVFLTEEHASVDDMPAGTDWVDYLKTFKEVMSVYRYGGWDLPAVIATLEVPMLCLPGDQMNAPFLLSWQADGRWHFTTSRYKESFWVDPSGMGGDESLTPDNKLVIEDWYLPTPSASRLDKGAVTHIDAAPMTGDGFLCSFYGIGTLTGSGDVLTADWGTPDKPGFIVTVQNYTTISDDTYVTMYYVYDGDGKQVKTLATYAEGAVGMSDIAGQPRQVMMITPDINGYIFNFVNLNDGNAVLSVPSSFKDMRLTTNLDRYAVAGGYRYACELNQSDTDQDLNVRTFVAHWDTDGNVARIDTLNMGPDVAYAQVYIDAQALSPYIFNTDNAPEYMTLVKRYVEIDGSTTREELLVLQPGNPTPLMKLLPDATKGALASVMLTGQGADRRLLIIYRDNNYNYFQDIYRLPLTVFAGGQGTATSPYRIASVGDLQAMARDPRAHYAIVNDFDAAGFDFVPVADFSGTLDGGRHTISNLSLSAPSGHVGLFSTATATAIKGLTLVDPTVTLTAANSASGTVAGTVMGSYNGAGDLENPIPDGSTLEDIHIYGLKVVDQGFENVFGGVAGITSLATGLTHSYVRDANIAIAQAEALGGLVGQLNTGSMIAASAFNGTLAGDTYVGGIAGNITNQDATVANCHASGTVTATNTVGGIVGRNNRGTVDRNVYTGTVRALAADRWQNITAAGGIVGRMEADFQDSDKRTALITNNTALLDALTVPQGTADTAHRIVGWTRGDAKPDPDAGADAAPILPEATLANNSALDTTAPFDAAQARADGTDGATVTALPTDNLGHGTTADSPWNHDNGAIYFENNIMIEQQLITRHAGETFLVPVTITRRDYKPGDDFFDDLSVNHDETTFEMTGNYSTDHAHVYLEFKAVKPGAPTTLAVSALGHRATTTVQVLDQGGVDNIVADGDNAAPAVYYDLRGVRVDNPVHGLFIEVRGNTARKVIVD